MRDDDGMHEVRQATREDLLAIKPPTKKVTPPGHDFTIEVGGLNALQQSRVNQAMMSVKYGQGATVVEGKLEGIEPLICSYGVIAPKMTAAEWGELPTDLVHFVADEVRKLSGLDVTVEEAEKN